MVRESGERPAGFDARPPGPSDDDRAARAGSRHVMLDDGDLRGPAAEVVRRPGRGRLVLVAAGVVVVVAAGVPWVLTAGGSETTTPDATAAVATASAAGSALDRYTASDLRFYQPFRPGQASLLVPQPVTLEAAFAEATVTVVAEVAGVRAGRSIGDLQHVEVELRVKQVLRGALRPELNGVVRVEFPSVWRPASIEATAASMRERLPENPGVWLLRWQGEPPPTRKPGARLDDPTADKSLYRPIHPNIGVFVQGEGNVVAATAQAGPARDAQREGEQLRHLSDLVAKVKS